MATVMPSTTPPTSWSARPVRSPCVTPTAITAAIAAKAGRGSGSSAVASSHAAIAAVAFCTIGSMRPRRRERAVSMRRIIQYTYSAVTARFHVESCWPVTDVTVAS